ncbi:unnamed protein product, partial [Didymodactylos carnosus]
FHEYNRIRYDERQPLFSAIRVALRIDRETMNNMHGRKKNIELAFQKFISFFQQNNITIYFGSVMFDKDDVIYKNSFIQPQFPTFIQNYSWSILTSMGCRVQEKLNTNENFKEIFLSGMSLIDKEEQDDIMYYMCSRLYYRALKHYFIDFYEEFIDIWKQYYSFYKTSLMSQFPITLKNEVFIPCVTLTSSTDPIVKPFKLSKSNRVLREPQFGNLDNFIFVEFRDDNGNQLQSRDFVALCQHFKQYLTTGFIIGGRSYCYLHHAQSQVRFKQFYYYCEMPSCFTFEEAYRWMGNFANERVVAKYAARMAQCFSSTQPTIQIKADLVKYVDDIISSDNKYTFTDGVGMISKQLSNKVITVSPLFI